MRAMYFREQSGAGTLPEETEQLLASGVLNHLKTMREHFLTIDPKAVELTDQIVNEDNLVVYMMRHQKPEAVEKESDGMFPVATRSSVWNIVNRIYKRKVSKEYLPRHAFVWFKHLPDGIFAEFPYRSMDSRENRARVATYFGDNIYEFPYATIKAKHSLLSIGDFTFLAIRNLWDLAATGQTTADDLTVRNAMSNKGDPYSFVPKDKEIKLLRGYFAPDDLRPLYFKVFSALRWYLRDHGGKIDPKDPVKIQMPQRDSFEVVIFDPLSLEEGALTPYKVPNIPGVYKKPPAPPAPEPWKAMLRSRGRNSVSP
jgi:hypothetical protein